MARAGVDFMIVARNGQKPRNLATIMKEGPVSGSASALSSSDVIAVGVTCRTDLASGRTGIIRNHEPGAPALGKRHETPDPARSNALECRFHGVRRTG
jgi:hypothetical protein